MIAVIAVVALFGLKLGYDQVAGMFDDRAAQLDTANKKISRANPTSMPATAPPAKSPIGKNAPSPAIAKSPKSPTKTGSSSSSPNTTSARKTCTPCPASAAPAPPIKQGLEKFGFEVKGVSDISIKQLVDFLYDFYASNQLHTIRLLEVRPLVDAQHLEIHLQIEAMLLPGAKTAEGRPRRDKLSDVRSNHLASAKWPITKN